MSYTSREQKRCLGLVSAELTTYQARLDRAEPVHEIVEVLTRLRDAVQRPALDSSTSFRADRAGYDRDAVARFVDDPPYRIRPDCNRVSLGSGGMAEFVSSRILCPDAFPHRHNLEVNLSAVPSEYLTQLFFAQLVDLLLVHHEYTPDVVRGIWWKYSVTQVPSTWLVGQIGVWVGEAVEAWLIRVHTRSREKS
jgi:hypothetical protein